MQSNQQYCSTKSGQCAREVGFSYHKSYFACSSSNCGGHRQWLEMCVCVYVFVCACVFVCVRLCVYIHVPMCLCVDV